MSTNISLNTNEYEKCIFGFIDLLGFKYLIENKDFKFIKEIFDEISPLVSPGSVYTEKLLTVEWPLTVFSDSIFISMPIDIVSKALAEHAGDQCGESDFRSLTLPRFFLYYISFIQNILLDKGVLSRGCISVGNVYHSENIWFGPAIVDAYKNETRRAIYPRVMLSDSFIQEFGFYCSNSNELLVDFDGVSFVNYFDENMNISKTLQSVDSEIDRLSEDKKVDRSYEIQKWEWLKRKLSEIQKC